MRDSTFRKIVVVNDWESVGYYLEAKKSAAGTWSHGSLDQKHRIKDNDLLEVQWPDGTVTTCAAKVTQRQTSYDDWGHTYSTITEDLFLPTTFKGTIVTAPIEQVKVRRKQ